MHSVNSLIVIYTVCVCYLMLPCSKLIAVINDEIWILILLHSGLVLVLLTELLKNSLANHRKTFFSLSVCFKKNAKEYSSGYYRLVIVKQ